MDNKEYIKEYIDGVEIKFHMDEYHCIKSVDLLNYVSTTMSYRSGQQAGQAAGQATHFDSGKKYWIRRKIETGELAVLSNNVQASMIDESRLHLHFITEIEYLKRERNNKINEVIN